MNAETPGADAYRDWDAAYLLGSLSAADRRAYERHLRECPGCREALAEFVPLPGLLAQLPAAEALAMLSESPPAAAPAPPGLLERLGAATRAVRRRARVRVAGLVLAAAAVSAAAALLLPSALTAGDPTTGDPIVDGARTPSVVLAAAPGVPVEASVRFVPVPWGTRIDLDCSYRSTEGGATRAYVMYVTDEAGAEYAIGSWVSTPGSTMHPSLATGLHVSEIESVDVRLQDSGRVVLTGAP